MMTKTDIAKGLSVSIFKGAAAGACTAGTLLIVQGLSAPLAKHLDFEYAPGIIGAFSAFAVLNGFNMFAKTPLIESEQKLPQKLQEGAYLTALTASGLSGLFYVASLTTTPTEIIIDHPTTIIEEQEPILVPVPENPNHKIAENSVPQSETHATSTITTPNGQKFTAIYPAFA